MARLIRASSAIYVGTHMRPDGDALGSLLGLALALEGTGRRVAALCADPVPQKYRFLPGADRVQASPPDWAAELGIVVDCDGIARLGALVPAFSALPHLVDIDHHGSGAEAPSPLRSGTREAGEGGLPPSRNAFGEAQLIDSRAAATAELVYRLLRDMKLSLDSDVATCLYAALLTDTGRFCFANTTAHSLRIAGELVSAGADPHRIARSIYEERSLAAMHLLGLALSRLCAHLEGRVVSSTLKRQDFARTGAAPSDTEGIIDHLRAIGGPRVAVLIVEPNHGGVRVSLRSDGSVDVSEIALRFGGGGHAMAAGCTIEGSAEGVRGQVLAALVEALGPECSAAGGPR